MLLPFKIYELLALEAIELGVSFILMLCILRTLPFILRTSPKNDKFDYKVAVLNFVAFIVLMFVLLMIRILRLLNNGQIF